MNTNSGYRSRDWAINFIQFLYNIQIDNFKHFFSLKSNNLNNNFILISCYVFNFSALNENTLSFQDDSYMTMFITDVNVIQHSWTNRLTFRSMVDFTIMFCELFL